MAKGYLAFCVMAFVSLIMMRVPIPGAHGAGTRTTTRARRAFSAEF